MALARVIILMAAVVEKGFPGAAKEASQAVKQAITIVATGLVVGLAG